MSLLEIIQEVPGFHGWGHAEKIKFFGWHLHSLKGRERFNQVELRACYDELHLEKPPNVSPYLTSLMVKKPKEVLHDSKGYYLAGPVRTAYETKYGQRAITVQVHKLLTDLPGKVTDEAERLFLSEAISCLRSKAYRAAIVMTWNLAFDHLEDWVLTNSLAVFNARIHVRYPKKPASTTVRKKDDFGDFFKESEFLEICSSANIITGDLKKILDEKLARRNIAAHPSLVEITQLQAEDFVTDLVNNVVLKLS